MIACLPFASQRHDDQRTANLTVVRTYWTFTFRGKMFSQQSSIHSSSLRTVASAGAILSRNPWPRSRNAASPRRPGLLICVDFCQPASYADGRSCRRFAGSCCTRDRKYLDTPPHTRPVINVAGRYKLCKSNSIVCAAVFCEPHHGSEEGGGCASKHKMDASSGTQQYSQ